MFRYLVLLALLIFLVAEVNRPRDHPEASRFTYRESLTSRDPS